MASALRGYNDLDSVENADERLRARRNFVAVLDQFSSMVSTYRYDSAVAVSLLHRHHYLVPGMRMVERCEFVSGEPALVTAPWDERDVGAARPSRWALMDGQFAPLEYSLDLAVVGFDAIDPTFLKRFGELLMTEQMDDLLGLAIAPREHLRLKPNEMFIEDSTDGSSIVTKGNEIYDDSSMIVTSWVYDDGYAGCRVGTQCRQWSTCRRSGGPDPRHSFVPVHDRYTSHERY